MKNLLCTIALSPGAENGVGPELILLSLENLSVQGSQFLWCGDKASLECARSRIKTHIHYSDNSTATLKNGLTINFFDDFPNHFNEHQRAARFLENCVQKALEGKVQAIVTGPIEKAALSCLAGGPWPGQTEYFAHHLGDNGKPFMAFLGGPFIMSMLSVHVALRKVPELVVKSRITECLQALALECARILKKDPKKVAIAVLGLNPHAGEQGLLGNEEIEHVVPAIKEMTDQGYTISGPWAADGFFGYLDKASKPDAVLAMYHDQGLIAYKLLAKGAAVNATLGLCVPRTSPAHGTARELVGTGTASYESTLKALELAIKLAQ